MTLPKGKYGNLDKRYRAVKDYLKEEKEYRDRQFRNALIASALLGALAGAVLTVALWRATREVKAQQVVWEEPVVTPTPTREHDPMSYIRWRGQQLGYDDYTISRFIRIARCESNFNQYAKNPNSTAKGIYQFIDGTWRANCLKDGNVYDFKDNIECFYKVVAKQGTQPWNASRRCWL